MIALSTTIVMVQIQRGIRFASLLLCLSSILETRMSRMRCDKAWIVRYQSCVTCLHCDHVCAWRVITLRCRSLCTGPECDHHYMFTRCRSFLPKHSVAITLDMLYWKAVRLQMLSDFPVSQCLMRSGGLCAVNRSWSW